MRNVEALPHIATEGSHIQPKAAHFYKFGKNKHESP